MPSIGNALMLWNIKSRTDGGNGTSSSRFLVSYEEDSGHLNGTQIIILIVAAFFTIVLLVSVACFCIVARLRARKRAKSRLKARSDGKKPLSSPQPAGPLDFNLATETASTQRAPSPALCSPQPRYAYSKATPFLEATSDMTESSMIPSIRVSSLEEEEELSTALSDSDLSILPPAAFVEEETLEEGQDQDQVNFSGGRASEDSNASASFFSVEMLEEMSSIATDLRRLSYANSIDIEIKNVNSKRSSVVIEQEQEPQPASCSVESDRDCSSPEEEVEVLEDILSELEGMVSVASQGDLRVSLKETPSRAGSSTIERSEGSSTPPSVAQDVQDTSLDNDDTLVSSPTKRSETLGSAASFILKPVLALFAEKSVNLAGTSSSCSILASPSGARMSVGPGTLLPPANSEETIKETSFVQPSLSRPALAIVKLTALSNGVRRVFRPARKNHARASSQVLSENRRPRAVRP